MLKASEALAQQLKQFSNPLIVVIALLSGVSAQAEVLVGFIGPLSGEVAAYGEAAKNGIQMAFAEQPNVSSSVRFIFEDDRFDSKVAISAYRKLRDTDHVDFIFPVGARAGAALAPIAEREGG